MISETYLSCLTNKKARRDGISSNIILRELRTERLREMIQCTFASSIWIPNEIVPTISRNATSGNELAFHIACLGDGVRVRVSLLQKREEGKEREIRSCDIQIEHLSDG